ncbi:MAG: calcineurin-like phosphoesterase C-terminal domain-containing protein [Candidatus Cryptobacteroides sp.]
MKTVNNIISLAFILCLACAAPGIARSRAAGQGIGKPLRVAFVGDPQVDNARELDFARRSVIRELAGRKDIDLAVFLGDIVNDSPELLLPMKQSLDSLPFPYCCIPGNHDDPDVFRSVFGYRDTSFAVRRIRFVLMDNSSGVLSPEQKRRLSGYLGIKSAKTVLCTHIPLKSGRDSSFAIAISQEGLLLVSAHLHRVFRETYRSGNEEISVGASCGSWWRGPLQDGIPYALMNCGAPRGYFIADFRKNGNYSLSYKAIGLPDSEQASLTRTRDSIFVNVWGGSPDAEVTLRVCSGGRTIRQRCTLSRSVAPEVMEVIESNSSAGPQWRKTHRDEFIPLRRMASSHLWSCPFGGETCTALLHYRDRRMKLKKYEKF